MTNICIPTALVWFQKNAYIFNIIIRARATTPLPLFKSIVIPDTSAHKCLLVSKLICVYSAQTLSRSVFFGTTCSPFSFLSLPSTVKARGAGSVFKLGGGGRSSAEVSARQLFNPRPGRAFSITRPGMGVDATLPDVSKLSVVALREKDQSIAFDEYSRLVAHFLP